MAWERLRWLFFAVHAVFQMLTGAKRRRSLEQGRFGTHQKLQALIENWSLAIEFRVPNRSMAFEMALPERRLDPV
jgi:hypothetical protein